MMMIYASNRLVCPILLTAIFPWACFISSNMMRMGMIMIGFKVLTEDMDNAINGKSLIVKLEIIDCWQVDKEVESIIRIIQIIKRLKY